MLKIVIIKVIIVEMQEDEYDYLFKLVMIGDSRVGKTNLLMRYTKDEFDNNTVTTVGVQFARKMI